MKRIQITRDCEARSRTREGSGELHQLERGTILYLLHDDDGDNYNVALGGQPVLVPKSCAVVIESEALPVFAPTDTESEGAPEHDAANQEADVQAAMSNIYAERQAVPAPREADHALSSSEASAAPLAVVWQQVDRGPLIAGALALLTAFSTTQTWARVLVFPIDGTDSDRGIVALIAALAAAGVCGWRAFLGLRQFRYFVACVALGLLSFGMSFWFLADVLTEPATELFGSEVRIITASWALYLTVIASAAFVISVIAQMVKARGQSQG